MCLSRFDGEVLEPRGKNVPPVSHKPDNCEYQTYPDPIFSSLNLGDRLLDQGTRRMPMRVVQFEPTSKSLIRSDVHLEV
jgi:hypothetical protein